MGRNGADGVYLQNASNNLIGSRVTAARYTLATASAATDNRHRAMSAVGRGLQHGVILQVIGTSIAVAEVIGGDAVLAQIDAQAIA
jgi:hypothetical protein